MNRIQTAAAALVGLGLVAAAGTVLVDGTDPGAAPVLAGPPAHQPQPPRADVQPVVDVVDHSEVRLVDPLLVVNKDGSAAVGAFVENGTAEEVDLMGVLVWVDGMAVRVNATEMWLPVLAGDRSPVGAASDAGGFLVPDGIDAGVRAEVAFRFDDGTCIVADVTAAARTKEHSSTYPKSNRSIGPVSDDEPPARSAVCGSE